MIHLGASSDAILAAKVGVATLFLAIKLHFKPRNVPVNPVFHFTCQNYSGPMKASEKTTRWKCEKDSCIYQWGGWYRLRVDNNKTIMKQISHLRELLRMDHDTYTWLVNYAAPLLLYLFHVVITHTLVGFCLTLWEKESVLKLKTLQVKCAKSRQLFCFPRSDFLSGT